MQLLRLITMKAPTLGWPIVAFLIFPYVAFATMTPLTEFPSDRSDTNCEKWAETQDEDAVYMWGIMQNGEYSIPTGLKRLTLYCLGDEKPEIVGFGSSIGFDKAYCSKHKNQRLCKL